MVRKNAQLEQLWLWIARILLLLLFLKVNWGIWNNWEWAMGDNAGQYANGRALQGNWLSWGMAWAPLYIFYYGVVGSIVQDPFLASLTHRVVVVFVVTFLQFEVMRRLIPVAAAWLVVAWWLFTPLNMSPLYVVHLFAHGANLACCLALVCSQTPRQRGWALALLAGTAAFARTETIATFVFTAAALSLMGFLEGQKSGDIGWRPLLKRSRPYLIPIMAIFGVVLTMCAISQNGIHGSWHELRSKAAFNFSQNYSYTYKQRYPETEGNVWYIYQEICQKDFGTPQVSVSEAARANPAAFFGHVGMNASNLPTSFQTMMFNARASERDSDVVPTVHNPRRAWLGTCLYLALIGAGTVLIFRERSWYIERTFRPQIAGWACYLGFFFQLLPVGLLILPRSSFLISGVSFLFLLAGLSAWAIWRKSPKVLQSQWAFLVIAVLVLWLSPWVWNERTRPYDVPRAINTAIGDRRLELQENGSKILASVYQFEEIGIFLDPINQKISVDGISVLLPALREKESFGDFLNEEKYTMFLACGMETEQEEKYKKFAEDPGESGWQLTEKLVTGDVQMSIYEPVDEKSE